MELLCLHLMETEAQVRWSSKLLLSAFFVLSVLNGIRAAEYRNGQLCLEVNLVSSAELKLKTSNTIRVSEQDGLIYRDLEGSFNISLVNPQATSWYGVLAKKETGNKASQDSTAVSKEYFAWEDRKLLIKHENLFFLPQSFSTRTEAENYAKINGISLSKVMEIPLVNSTVKLSSSNAEIYYLETPLEFVTEDKLFINGSDLGYEGHFILKTINGKLVLNHFISLEEYLAGVVPNEIGNTAPLEALKAQAVAARTHALSLLSYNRHKADGYDLCSGTHCQVYKGKYLQNANILKALEECKDEALFQGGQIADAPYHSSCGGKTDSSSAIWKGKPISHLNGVTCIAEADTFNLSMESDARKWIDTKLETAGMTSWERGALSWEKSISKVQVAKNAGLKFLRRIDIMQRGRSGRIVSLKLYGDKEINLDNEYKIRQVFGGLLSSFFYFKGSYRDIGNGVSLNPKAILQIKGKGAGHGVGMCQVGTLRLARTGASYHDILRIYYPGTTISRDWINE